MTVHWSITANSTTSFTAADAADGDTFVIDNGSTGVAIVGLSDTTAMAFGYGDGVQESSYGPNSIIQNYGNNTRIEIDSDPKNPDTNVINIFGFDWWKGATLEQTIAGSDPNNTGPGSKPTLFYQADLWSSVRPDGHGGTMVGVGANIDLRDVGYIGHSQFPFSPPPH